MIKTMPKDLEEAVVFGLGLLNDQSQRELEKIGWVNPHTKYNTEFIDIIGTKLGIWSMENKPLLLDIAINHADCLSFFEVDGATVEPDAAIRVVLTAMSKAAAALRRE